MAATGSEMLVQRHLSPFRRSPKPPTLRHCSLQSQRPEPEHPLGQAVVLSVHPGYQLGQELKTSDPCSVLFTEWAASCGILRRDPPWALFRLPTAV